MNNGGLETLIGEVMDFAATFFFTEYSIGPKELAIALEERGFDALFLSEHTHIPACRTSPSPLGGELDKQYWHTFDPYIALMAAGAATEKLKLGTGIALVAQHDPIILAKQIATLDYITGGRTIIGIGGGWNAEEMANHGVDFKNRWKMVRETVLAMKTIWREDEPEFHGEFIDFDPMWSYPKPSQTGGPKILMGAMSKWAFDRAAEYCDGWIPGAMPGFSGLLEQYKEAVAKAGRSLDDMDITVGAGPDEKIIAKLRGMQGINRLMFPLPSAPAEEILPMLDNIVKLMEK